MNKDEFIICKVCNKKLVRIGSHLLSKHNLSSSEYLKLYPGSLVWSKKSSERHHNIMVERWKEEDYKEYMKEIFEITRNKPEYKKKTSEAVKKSWDDKRRNWFSELMIKNWSDPVYRAKHKTEEDMKKFRENTIQRNLNDNPAKKPETRKKSSERFKRLWKDPTSKFNSKEYKLTSEAGRKKAYDNWLKNSPYIWEGVGFLSNYERECAKLILTKPILGYNCHIKIGRRTIDFFPQEDDKLFIGKLVEFHPCPQRFDERTLEEYYADRLKGIENSKYKGTPLLVLTSLEQVQNEIRGEK